MKTELSKRPPREGGAQHPPHEAERIAGILRGDQKAMTAFLRSKRPLIASIARGLWDCGVPFDDLVQEGYLGLLEAMERYKSNECRFDAYATSRIRGRMLDAVRQYHAQSKRGISIRAIPKVRAAVDRLTQRNEGRPPSASEIAREAGMSERGVRKALFGGAMRVTSDFSEPGSDAFRSADARAWAVRESELRHRSLLDSVDLALETAPLSPREREVVGQYYGLTGGKGRNLADIGREYGVTESRACQIRIAAVRKIRQRLAEILG